MHAPPEAYFALDLDNRDTIVESGLKLRLLVDVDRCDRNAVPLENFPRVVAKVAALTRVEDGVHYVGGALCEV